VSQSYDTTTEYDPATQPKRPELSLGELIGEMTGELSTLFRKESRFFPQRGVRWVW
jgi:hypothetical protein